MDNNRDIAKSDDDPIRVTDEIFITEAVLMAKDEAKEELAEYDNDFAQSNENPVVVLKMQCKTEISEVLKDENISRIIGSIYKTFPVLKPSTDTENNTNKSTKNVPEHMDVHQNLQIDEMCEHTEENLGDKVPYEERSLYEQAKRFNCDLCPKTFSLEESLNLHKRCKHLGLPKYSCPQENCTLGFKVLEEMRKHLNDHDGIPHNIHKCRQVNCGMHFNSSFGLKKHTKIQHNVGPPIPEYVCETCGVNFKTNKALKTHQYLHVDEALWPYKCDVEGCSKNFRKKFHYEIHKNRHNGIKPYACKICDKSFCAPANLKVHVNFHTRAKLWKCNLCSLVFALPATLRKHIKRVHQKHPDALFPCSFCSKILSTKTNRTIHEKIHTGDKPFVCAECGRAFTLSHSLEQHMEKHNTGEKPFACDRCEQKFTILANLKRHKRIHQKFNCRFCRKIMITALSLKYHEMTHTREKPHSCEACGVKFRYQRNLLTHHKESQCGKSRNIIEPEPVIDEDELLTTSEINQMEEKN